MHVAGRRYRTATRVAAIACAAVAVLPGTAAAQQPQGAAEPDREERFETVDRRDTRASRDDFERARAARRRGGKLRMIVGLRVAFTPEGGLSEAGRGAQRDDIARATADVRDALAGSDHRVLHTYATVPYVAVELSDKALDRLDAAGVAATLQEDTTDRPTLAQSRVIVEAAESAAVGRAGQGQAVAILDTGVAKTHPFLQQSAGVPKVVSEACYSGNANCPGGAVSSIAAGSGVNCTYAESGCRHGTHVAGIAAGKGASFSGVAKEARLIAIQVFSRFTGTDCADAGEDPCTLSFVSDQMKGLERVYQLRNTFSIGAANMSLGGGSFTSACDGDSRKPAVDNLRSARIPTVIASGNDGFTNAVGSPGCISTAVTVGSTDKSDAVSLFSNTSSLVDLFAPGQQINSSVPGNGFAVLDGTSMATPHVAGAWAIMRQVDPAATVLSVQDAFNQTGKPITDPFANPPVTRDRIRVFSAAANRKHTGFGAATVITEPGAGLASAGVGLARRTGADDNPTSAPPSRTLQLTGIPPGAQVVKAWLIWQTVGGPDATALFRGTTRAGTLVGGSGQFTCWSTNDGGAVRTYRYAIPAGEVTGNGSYSVGSIGGVSSPTAGRPDGQGVTLLVAYRVPGSLKTGRAHIRFGGMTARPGAPAATHTFTGLTVPGPVGGAALHLGIGDGESFSDPSMTFGGTTLTPANYWSGTDGPYWDDRRLALNASRLPAGTTSRTNSQGASGECLTWAFAALTYQHD